MRVPPLQTLFTRTDLPVRLPLCLILLVALILRVGVAFFSAARFCYVVMPLVISMPTVALFPRPAAPGNSAGVLAPSQPR